MWVMLQTFLHPTFETSFWAPKTPKYNVRLFIILWCNVLFLCLWLTMHFFMQLSALLWVSLGDFGFVTSLG